MLEDFRNEPFTDFSAPKCNRPSARPWPRSRPVSAGGAHRRQRSRSSSGSAVTTGKILENSTPPTARRSCRATTWTIARRAESRRDRHGGVRELEPLPAPGARRVLLRAARRMRERRHEFSAWMVLEVGKSWAEADADTAEAIDFLEFYAARCCATTGRSRSPQLPGERTRSVYIPLGVGAVIPPWNFPLAICVGMTTAAIVTGNTVRAEAVERLAGASPGGSSQLMEEVGLPPGVVNFVTGAGGEVGDTSCATRRPASSRSPARRRSGSASTSSAARSAAGPDLDQARRRRDGRQGRHHRRRGGRPRRGRDGRGRLGLRLPGPEVLGLLARDRPREGLRRVPAKRSSRRSRRSTIGDPDRTARHLHGPGRERAGAKTILDYIEIGQEGGRLAGRRRRGRQPAATSSSRP